MTAYDKYVYKEKCIGDGKGKGKTKPQGVKVKREKDCGNLVYLDWHIQDHCLEL